MRFGLFRNVLNSDLLPIPQAAATRDLNLIHKPLILPSRMHRFVLPSLIILVLHTTVARSQSPSVHDENIKTVLIHPTEAELAPPIIPLDGDETLVLRFDDLAEDFREMSYSFTHCTYDWQPSDLQPMDYQEGFQTDLITDYEFSFNTLIPYTHYRVEFPNDRIRLTRSGNYLIEVFAEGDRDEPLLTARFSLAEKAASIQAIVRKSSVVADRPYRQELEVEVSLGSQVQTMNPYDEIKLVVLQNLRRDNAIRDIKPRFVKNNQLIYDFHDGLTFDGGNEYRRFDAKSFRYRSEEVQSIDVQDGVYHIRLSPDAPRAYKQYSFVNDINGKFLIQNDDMNDPHLESDYAMVHFSVPVDAVFGRGTLYLYGQLSRWGLHEDFAMQYDPESMSYRLTKMLKQGYYNYAYLWRNAAGDTGSYDQVMGNHSETENDYTILVYFTDRSSFADRLLAVRTVNSLHSAAD